jgi:soluble lytic murein transglycosylase-like protein
VLAFAVSASAQVPPAPVSVAPQLLTPADTALYRELVAAARAGQAAKVSTLSARLGDPTLKGYVEAELILSPKSRRHTLAELIDWLRDYRDLAVADRIYRLAVSRSTTTVKKGKKRIKVAVVTNIPAPAGVGTRSGGYEDAELLPPTPRGDDARSVFQGILADIKAGNPDAALARLDSVRATATTTDIAILTHRIAASYLAETRNADAYALATSVSDPAVPQLLWDAGFAAYRMGRWDDAITHLEALAQNAAAQNTLRAQGAFWSARAHMRTGDPRKVITLLSFAAKQNPSFYGIIAERALGMDITADFSDPVMSAADFSDLMRAGGARRAVALWQVGGFSEYIGPELNRAFVQNDERLDPAMAALARAVGVPNVELRASEKSAARGVLLTGLFPVPNYAPADGYRVDHSLVLAFARIESRFQTGATSPVGARGLMQVMPGTARALGFNPASLDDPSVALSAGQKYIVQLLDRLNGSLLELGGAYNAGPGAVDRWITTKAGREDPLLFVESIPVFETRSYVKRLMLYHWLYQRRFDEAAHSLDQTARGAWPVYRPASKSNAPILATTAQPPALANAAVPAPVQITNNNAK